MAINNSELSAPVRQTNWHVITGAPCSGKTAVIEALNRRGYRVVPEVARSYIDAQLMQGKHLGLVKADPLAFERHILNQKIETESALPAKEIIFLDRDSVAYFLVEGLDPAEPLLKSRSIRYRNIFLFDRLRFKKDAVRSEDARIAAQIDELLEMGYRRLGYDVIRVPVLSVQARTEFVIKRL